MSTRIHRPAALALFVCAAGALLYLCLSMLRPFAGVLAWALVLAITCYPMRQRLVRRTGRIALSAFVTSVVTVFALVVPLLMVGGVAINQSIALRHSLRAAIESPDRTLARTSAAVAAVAGRLGVDQAVVAGSLQRHGGEWMQTAGRYTTSFAAGMLEALASSLFVIVALFLLLRDGDRLVAALVDLLPFDRDHSRRLLGRIADVVQASVYGVVVMALIHGAVYGTAFGLLGIPSAAFWGMVTVFASVVPIVGAFAVWGPAAVYLALHGHWLQVGLLALTAALVSGIDHVLRPRLVAGRVGLSELAMFFALLGGVAMFGALGVILGPAAFATLAAITETFDDDAALVSDPTRPAIRRPGRQPSR